MKQEDYSVTIRATVTKTVVVKAINEAQAVMFAHENFDIRSDGEPEDYEQDTIKVERTK